MNGQGMKSVSMLDPGFAAMEKRLAGGASKGNKPMKPPKMKGLRTKADFSKGTGLGKAR